MNTKIEFHKVSEFELGTLYKLLKDAYSFNDEYARRFESDWRSFDIFFYGNLHIADKYGFITTIDSTPIGLVSWDPRNMPDYAIIGHNCISAMYKGNGFGTIQMARAVSIIKDGGAKRITVTTNSDLIPAQKMYERVGFNLIQRRSAGLNSKTIDEYLDYVMLLDGSCETGCRD